MDATRFSKILCCAFPFSSIRVYASCLERLTRAWGASLRIVEQLAARLGNQPELDAIRAALDRMKVGRPQESRHKVTPDMVRQIDEWGGPNPHSAKFAEQLGISRQYLHELREQRRQAAARREEETGGSEGWNSGKLQSLTVVTTFQFSIRPLRGAAPSSRQEAANLPVSR